jgi:hypothetical protein
MRLRRGLKILIVVLVILFSGNTALAAFGISPSQVINHDLLPDSHYEQTISLVRSDVSKEAKVEVTINAPEIGEWLSIDKGLSFTFAPGQKQVFMTARVDVPEDAELGNYKGTIAVRVVPEQIKEGGTVTIALGAQINVDLTVVEEKFFDFTVHSVDVLDLEEGNLIKVLLKIENIGNLEGRPTKVHLDVYDILGDTLLESGDDTSLDSIKPFEIKEIFAEFPTKLGIGQHWSEVKVYKDEEIVREERIFFSIVEREALPVTAEAGGGNWFQNQLSKFSDFYLYIGAGVFFLIAIILLIWAEKKRRKMTPRKKKTIKIMDIKKKEE